MTRRGNEKLLQDYLELHPDCSHLLAVLQHGRRDETDDNVSKLGFDVGERETDFGFLFRFFLGFYVWSLSYSSQHHGHLAQGLPMSASLDSDWFTS